jgi:hypothetical protein
MRRKAGLHEPASAAEATDRPRPVPIDGSPWSDDERGRVEEALAALRATRLRSQGRGPSQPPPDVPAREIPEAPPAPDAPVSIVMAPETPPTPEFAIPRRPAAEPLRWYGPDEVVEVAGYRLPGLVRVARSEFEANRAGRVAVVAGLEADAKAELSDFVSEVVTPQAATYSMLTPAGRAHFLAWLAAGCPSGAPLGFAHLRFVMLEGRVLDVTTSGLQRDERLAMKVAIEALIEQYGQNSWHLREHGRRLADILGVPECSARSYLQPPPLVAPTYEPPVPVQLALGQAARDKAPLPAAWALTALTADINIPKRVPLIRCAPEFAALFEARFRTAFPDGLQLRPSRHPLRLNYRPLGFGPNAAQPEGLDALVPNACATDFTPGQRSTLSDLLRRCADELADYSRYLGKVPDARGTPEAQLKLPETLLRHLLERGLGELTKAAVGKARRVTLEVAAQTLWGANVSLPAKSFPVLKAFLGREGFDVVEGAGAVAPSSGTGPSKAKKAARVRLDTARLERIKQDDAEVTRLLASLFAEASEHHPANPLPSGPVDEQPVRHRFAEVFPSLDLAHLQLLDVVLTRDHWSQEDLQEAASVHGLMVDGALERVNEAALDAFGDLLLTADQGIELNLPVASELRHQPVVAQAPTSLRSSVGVADDPSQG